MKDIMDKGDNMIVREPLAEKYLIELFQIFVENNWEIQSEDDEEQLTFDMFCKRLNELDSDADRELIMELTHKYLVVNVEEYSKYLIDVTRKFLKDNKKSIDTLDTLHIFPVQDANYLGKTKSGNLMCYLLQGCFMRRFKEFHDKRIRIIETFDALEKYRDDIECLILIDDFIGSGDSVLECVNLIEERGIEKDKIKAIALVLQEQGKKAIEEYGINVYSSVLRNKAITDNYSKEEAEKKKEQMKGIGKKIKANKELYLGYKESEGLVTMIKTPNNTFPFYWFEKKKEGKHTTAPFPRRNNIGVDE